MSLPNVINVLHDPRRRVTYRVVAFRTLTRAELILAVRLYNSQRKGKPAKAGDEITIVSAFGA